MTGKYFQTDKNGHFFFTQLSVSYPETEISRPGAKKLSAMHEHGGELNCYDKTGNYMPGVKVAILPREAP